jgi:hypothetical protein
MTGRTIHDVSIVLLPFRGRWPPRDKVVPFACPSSNGLRQRASD